MGVTQAGFCIATEDRLWEGGSRVPAEGVGRRGLGVAVTEQRDRDQEGGGRKEEGRRKD